MEVKKGKDKRMSWVTMSKMLS